MSPEKVVSMEVVKRAERAQASAKRMDTYPKNWGNVRSKSIAMTASWRK